MSNFYKAMPETRLSYYQQQPADKEKLLPIVREALRKNMWLFNKVNSNWYTPEEFTAKYKNTELNNYEMSRLLENLIIRDPRSGNSAYHKQIEKEIEQHQQRIHELRRKGETFLDRVISYYLKKSTGK